MPTVWDFMHILQPDSVLFAYLLCKVGPMLYNYAIKEASSGNAAVTVLLTVRIIQLLPLSLIRKCPKRLNFFVHILCSPL